MRRSLLQSITKRLNASTDLYGLQPVTVEVVRVGIESLERDGDSIEYLTDREELIALRILRLDPSKLAI